MKEIELPQPIDFDWDEFNTEKSRLKHGTTTEQAEQTFFNNSIIFPDESHSSKEQRYQLIGSTNSGKVLFIAFTLRTDQIRIISARPASKKERTLYAQEIKKTS